jgi:M6 family metalloprotease-like protein
MPPTRGVLHMAMLFVDFSDSSANVTPQSIYDMHVPPLTEYYRTVSYGRLQVDVVPLLRWLRLPRTLSEYQEDRFVGAVESAVAAADASFDFSSVGGLYLVAAMPSLASTIVDDVPLRVDGAAIHAWAWLATGSLERLPRVAIHETGHVLGLPDLYRESIPSSQHGWDVMTAAPSGGGLFAWHRWKLGWIEPAQIVCLTRRGSVQVTLAPVERSGGRKALFSRVGRTVVAVEVRRQMAEDASICKSGVLFYRVDFDAGAPENVGARRRPVQLQPARKDDPRRWNRCGREWRAPYALGRGEVGRASAWGHRLQLLKRLPDGSYRVRVTRVR